MIATRDLCVVDHRHKNEMIVFYFVIACKSGYYANSPQKKIMLMFACKIIYELSFAAFVHLFV